MDDGMIKRVTLKDVARAADVSLASASYALNGTGSLGDAVRAHILKIADDLGYRRNLSARAMRTGKTGAIGLVVPDFSNPFFTALAQFVMKSARQAGYCVFVADTENSVTLEQEAFHRMIDRGVDGVVWFPIRDVNTVEAESRRVPTLLIDRAIPGLPAIRANYEGGGRRAAEHLLAQGHTSVSASFPGRSRWPRCGRASTALGQRWASAWPSISPVPFPWIWNRRRWRPSSRAAPPPFSPAPI